MKEQCEHEVEKLSMRSRHRVQISRESAEDNSSFSSNFQQEFFLAMSSEFTFGDNSDEFIIFRFFLDLHLVDRDLTQYQITQTLTLS